MNPELTRLFESHFGEKVKSAAPLKADGSYRLLYRIASEKRTAIGVENADRLENIAFIEFSRYFRKCGLPAPEIYAENLDANIYLEEDLGDDTLFDLLAKQRADQNDFPVEIEKLYEKVVRILPEFQIRAAKNFNYDLCYPRHSFDRQSVMWDLNYFKYYFLKLAQIPFNEQKLEDDFEKFTAFLMEADQNFFLYRDFQSRNIMIRNGEPFFIDYQGGRRGALQYDIASLLFDAKANLPFDARDRLLQIYLDSVSEVFPLVREANPPRRKGVMSKFNRDEFMRYYYGYVLVRILQAMGAYGFRGFYERKTHFLQSVPFALRNLEHILKNVELPVKLPMLTEALHSLVRSTRLRELGDAQLPLTVRIESFSYKNGLPQDDTGHGGGFIFDCRALPNPGRLEKFANQTGFDSEVIAFLETSPEVHSYLTRVRDLIAQVIENYQQRNFSHLSVAFGCTGGQHRSVYCANALAKYLAEKHGVKVEVAHRELGRRDL
jgi:aminoglycoside/choline kinase family phosphotransferase